MNIRTLGRTGIEVSPIAFGAGPIPELMTDDDSGRQQAVLQRAVEAGINWIDTAASYGQGRSEQSLGEALAAIDAVDAFHLATKVRLMPEDLERRSIREIVRDSMAGSLDRLGVERVTLLQLHNSLTSSRGEQPTSLTPEDVLDPGGVLEAMRELRDEGLVGHLGLTGIGQSAAMREVVASGEFDTMQVPFNLLNPTAGVDAPGRAETDYGNIIADCRVQQMGVFAIRVFAGGALLSRPPAKHTFTTKFFPLDLYQRDVARARRLADRLVPDHSLHETAVRFVLSHPGLSAAIIGFSEPDHVDQAVAAAARDPLDDPEFERLISGA